MGRGVDRWFRAASPPSAPMYGCLPMLTKLVRQGASSSSTRHSALVKVGSPGAESSGPLEIAASSGQPPRGTDGTDGGKGRDDEVFPLDLFGRMSGQEG
eukprot:scaffold145282_cov23-Tisochrysis_lutea.AAC.2